MPKTTVSETTNEILRQRSAALRDFATRFDRMAEEMESLRCLALPTSSGESWTRAIKSLIAYASAVQRAIDAKHLECPAPPPNHNHTAKHHVEPLIVAEKDKKYR